MENKNAKTTCKRADDGSFMLVCEPSVAEPEQAAAPVAETTEQETTQATVPTAPAMEPAQNTEPAIQQIDTEEIEVPVVGDTADSYVEPLGETASWYPESSSTNNVVAYQYGTTSQYTASLLHPEEGFTASDIILIAIIAASLLAVISTIILLTGRAAVSRRPVHKDFIRK